jgi:hypothetical protein
MNAPLRGRLPAPSIVERVPSAEFGDELYSAGGFWPPPDRKVDHFSGTYNGHNPKILVNKKTTAMIPSIIANSPDMTFVR